jgi:aspartate/methionine/tyrosine aminotransferase
VFLNVKKLGTDCRQVANFLLNEAGVATLAGADFDMYGEGYIRLSYATSLENLKKGLDRIKAAVVKITA